MIETDDAGAILAQWDNQGFWNVWTDSLAQGHEEMTQYIAENCEDQFADHEEEGEEEEEEEEED